MNIEHIDNQETGEFFVLDENQQKIARLTYFYIDAAQINANHTFVAESLRGKGVADKLYQHLVDFIGKNNLKLVPTCSYVARKWARENS